MPDLKHVGRLTTNNRKLIVAYKTIPNDPNNALVVHTESLDADMHDSLMKLVESASGQESVELADAMARTRIPDGRIMLAAFHTTGKLTKVPTNIVEMTPNNKTAVLLSDVNQAIADARGITIEELSLANGGAATTQTNADQEQPMSTLPSDEPVSSNEQVLDDDQLAASYRSQADAMFKEAKRLREMAEELVPTKKKKATSSA